MSFADSTAELATDTDGSVSITLSAPAGQMFVVDSPPGDALSAQLAFSVVYGDETTYPDYAPLSGTSLAFVVVNGSAPTLWSGEAFLPESTGNQLSASATVTVPSGFSFTSLTFSFDYDKTDITSASLGNFNLGILEYDLQFEGRHGNPGALMGLEQIPEPTHAGVMAAAVIIVVIAGRTWRQHRKAAL